MIIRRYYLLTFALIITSFPGLVFSVENFINVPSPIPSGCVTYYEYQGYYKGLTETLVDGEILINSHTATSAVTARLTVYRTGCAEDMRSILTVKLEVLDDQDGEDEQGIVPFFIARIGADDFPLRPTTEPNSWVNYESGIYLAEGTMRIWVLDVPTPLSEGFDAGFYLNPMLYNGGFTLLIDNPGTDMDYSAEISVYNNHLQPTMMPLNGRLSGIWVIEGASDQGILISFSELPGNATTGLIFFSWYTFDKDGNNVWFVGNATYDIGSGTVSFPLELVTNGVFMGSQAAERIAAGSVQITARHCNHLELVFDLSAVGLGQSTVAVVRIVGLETAGYTCQDPTSRAN